MKLKSSLGLISRSVCLEGETVSGFRKGRKVNEALLLRDNEKILVTAEEVLSGKYSRYDNFTDPEYEFKVRFVKGAKHGGGPYFRLYYSYEEYKQKYPDRADRYKIVANMRRYQESKWHKNWKSNFESFCEIEKCVKNPNTNKWKFADALYSEHKMCFEFQHSYIAWDFEERTEFYQNLGYGVVWLYDLSKAEVVENREGTIEILEDNARGFFRISENPDNLTKCPVYIQVKNGKIYRVKQLGRKEIASVHKSTIRIFTRTEEYTETEFVAKMRSLTLEEINREQVEGNNAGDEKKPKEKELKSVYDWWQPNYVTMFVKHENETQTFMVNRGANGCMFRRKGCIQYKYVSEMGSVIQKDFSLNEKKAKEKKWELKGFTVQEEL